MICDVCHKSVGVCFCADIDDRLKILASYESNSLLWAVCCDKHYKRCKCDKPHFMLSNEILKLKNNGRTKATRQA